MEDTNKKEFLDIYVQETLNEIKELVSKNIKLDESKTEEVDKKMSKVLRDLIENTGIETLNQTAHPFLSILPIKDETEIKKIKTSFALYYTALYYDNVNLLTTLLKEDIKFVDDWFINLYYLDKSISSKFEESKYIDMIKTCGYMIIKFAKSIEHLPEEERQQYVDRFYQLMTKKYEGLKDILINDKSMFSFKRYHELFTKSNLDTFDDDTYVKADKDQLELITRSYNSTPSTETCARLNYLMQHKGFKTFLVNFDLMMKLFNDDELSKQTFYTSHAIAVFSKDDEMLDKIIEFVTLRPDLAETVTRISDEDFMKIDIYTLIEVCDYLSVRYIPDLEDSEIRAIARIMKPKSLMKRALGSYNK